MYSYYTITTHVHFWFIVLHFLVLSNTLILLFCFISALCGKLFFVYVNIDALKDCSHISAKQAHLPYIVYENIDQIFSNKLHGPMFYTIRVHVYRVGTCSVLCCNTMTV